MTKYLILVAAILACFYLYVSSLKIRKVRYKVKSSGRQFAPHEPFPKEISDLVGSEMWIGNGKVKRRVDQLYRTQQGSLLLADTKTRSRFEVRDSDVQQLKDYRKIIQGMSRFKDQRIEPYGYIRVVRNAGTKFAKVKYMKVRIS
jgi:hypothetical protein